ncbi:MAG TPA: S53 family serine peptidase [Kineosporiaceae bacterium]|nr:S53 family serine peptidase [Kineosporiaceae bacterium]
MRPLSHLPRSAAVAVALAGSLGLAATGSIVASSASAADAGRIAVPNAQPALSGATATGAAGSGKQIDIKLYLADQNAAELDRLVQAVSTPGTAQYGKYLTPAQFRARFAPSAATVDSVQSFLTDAGLAVTGVAGNRSYVQARGTVAKVQTAFGTSLKQYTLQGQSIRAAATAPTVPAALKGKVIALSGLASISQLMVPSHEDGAKVQGSTAARTTVAAKSSASAPPPDAFVNARPCSSYFGQKIAKSKPKAYGKRQPYAPCGYTPKQLQGAYDLKSTLAKGLDGRGVTVAITDAYAAPTILADANKYATRHGQKAFRKGQFTQVLPDAFRYGYDDTVNGDLCGEQGWYGEETLDVEAVHAVAPGANITYVASPSCDNQDFADTLNKVVDGHLADIVTNSWGGTDESNGSPELDQVYEQIFSQAAAQGIGFYFSSGDSGDGSSAGDPTATPPIPPNGPTTQAPANSPLVTAVGGTSLAVGKKSQRLYETGWSTSRSALTKKKWDPKPPGTYQYGGGGGTSRVFEQPWYQAGVVPSSLSKRYSPTKARVVPDISALGDPNTGFLVGETQTFPNGKAKYSEYRIGGTSLASPLFAGIMAIADQAARKPHGFANPALYKLYSTKALYDPKSVSNRGVVRVDYANGVDASDGLLTSLRSIDVSKGTILRTRKGYDDITGIGSPIGSKFVSSLK